MSKEIYFGIAIELRFAKSNNSFKVNIDGHESPV